MQLSAGCEPICATSVASVWPLLVKVVRVSVKSQPAPEPVSSSTTMGSEKVSVWLVPFRVTLVGCDTGVNCIDNVPGVTYVEASVELVATGVAVNGMAKAGEDSPPIVPSIAIAITTEASSKQLAQKAMARRVRVCINEPLSFLFPFKSRYTKRIHRS